LHTNHKTELTKGRLITETHFQLLVEFQEIADVEDDTGVAGSDGSLSRSGLSSRRNLGRCG